MKPEVARGPDHTPEKGKLVSDRWKIMQLGGGEVHEKRTTSLAIIKFSSAFASKSSGLDQSSLATRTRALCASSWLVRSAVLHDQ